MDQEVLQQALEAIAKAHKLFDEGKAKEAVDLYFDARKGLRQHFAQENLLGIIQ